MNEKVQRYKKVQLQGYCGHQWKKKKKSHSVALNVHMNVLDMLAHLSCLNFCSGCF